MLNVLKSQIIRLSDGVDPATVVSTVAAGICFIALVYFSFRWFVLPHRWYIRKAKRVYAAINKKGLNEGQIIAYLRKINPYVFEELVLLAFSKHGYSIERNKRYSGDGGVDGRVRLGGQTFLLQCKRYKNYINQNHVENFSGVCRKKRCQGFFVHTGKTGKASRQNAFISGNVNIVSGHRLAHLMMSQYEKSNI